MVTQIIGTPASQEQFSPQKTAPASRLGPEERKNLSLQVLAQTEPVSRLAQKKASAANFSISKRPRPQRPSMGPLSPSSSSISNSLAFALATIQAKDVLPVPDGP